MSGAPVSSTPCMTGALLRPLRRGLAVCGISSDEFFALIGLPADPTDQDRAPLHRVGAVLDMFARRTSTPHLSLVLARSMPTGALGARDYRWSASSTLFHAMMRSHAEAAQLTDGLRMELHIEGAAAVIAIRHLVDDHPPLLTELTSAMVVERIRHVLGHAVRLEHVRFSHAARGPTAIYDEFFGVPTEFSAAEDRFAFPAALLQQPLLTSDPELVRLLRAPPPRARPPKKSEDTLIERARSVLDAALRGGEHELDVAMLATRLGVSTRSLQRKLGDADTSFSQIRDEARRRLAIELLDDDTLLLADVADRLGFGDLTAFHRAFRRWTGVSPRAFRGHPLDT